MRLKCLYYDFQLVYTPGRELIIADTLSRAQLAEQYITDNHEVEQVSELTELIIPTEVQRQNIKALTKSDVTLQKALVTVLQTEWPASRKLCPDSIKPFWNEKDNLIEYDGLIFKGQQLVIPTALRPTIMKEVHSGHFGIVKCLERAKAAVYWPGYTLQIRDMVESCSLCQEHRRANSNMPLQQHPVPDHPYQVVGTDLFELDGQVYLLSVDFYSKWVCVEELQETRSIDVIRVQEKQLVDFGCPQRLISDNGPQYGSFEFREFAKRMNFEHVTSSPNYARSNGFSERSVQTVKNSLVKMLSDGKTLAETLIALRSTPVGNGLPSPAVLLQGRHLRSGLHCHTESLMPKVVSPQQVKRCLLDKQSQCTFYHDANKSFKDPLSPNQTVRVRKENRWVPATVVRHTNNPQSYWVRLTNGYVVRRNRTQINTTREEGLQTSSRVVGPNRAIVHDRVVGPNRAIVQDRVVGPNRAIVQDRVVGPNRAIVQDRVVGPNRAIVQDRVVGPNRAIVQDRVVEPNRAIVSCRAKPGYRIGSCRAKPGYRIGSYRAKPGYRVGSCRAKPGHRVESCRA